MAASKDNLIWLDLEMTGIDCRNDTVLEIATIVTNAYLDILAEGPVIAIHHDEEVLMAMDEWNTSTHGNSGLTERIRNSRYTMAEAEQETLDFLKLWVEEGCSPMCGNSICQDRRFLGRLMPDLELFFHYRNIDVSSIKELARRWAPEMASSFQKDSRHQALSDIKDSIAELRYYSKFFLNAPEQLKR